MKIKKKQIRKLIHKYQSMVGYMEKRVVFDIFKENDYVQVRINAYKDIIKDLEDLINDD